MVIINPSPVPPLGGLAYTHITPFTYRDGATYLEVLESLRQYIRDILVKHIDVSFDKLELYVDNAVKELTLVVDERLDLNEERINEAVQQVINNSIELQADVMAGIAADPDSDFRSVLESIYNTERFSGETFGIDYTGVKDSSAALSEALAESASSGRILETHGLIALASPVPIVGGAVWDGKDQTKVVALNQMVSALTTPVENVDSFRVIGVEFEGGRIVDDWTLEDLPRRKTTAGTTEWRPSFVSAINLQGFLADSSKPRISNVSIEGCHMHHFSGLPIFIQGVSDARVDSNLFEWTLDPGFIFCERPTFTNNTVRFMSDNGVSLSRGCTDISCYGNTFEYIAHWGIWFGGWDGTAGANGGVIANNVIRHVGMGFFGGLDAPRNILIANNDADIAYRGPKDNPSDNYGVAVKLTEMVGFGRASNIEIVGNKFGNTWRGGVHMVGVSTISIFNNMFLNMGNNPDVALASQTHNVGIFIDKTNNAAPDLVPNPRDHASRVITGGNTFLDDRATVLTNSGVTFEVILSSQYNTLMNVTPRKLREDFAEPIMLGGANPPKGRAISANINGEAGTLRQLQFMSEGVSRWEMRASNTPETGNNAGSDFALYRRSDTGASLGVPIQIDRVRGDMRLGESAARVGFFGSAGAFQGVAPAPATDAAGALALANSLRTILINLGLLKTV